MIHFLLGPPGAGKSYEAVVYHILPALQSGRKVITNVPLYLERIAAVEPGCSDLIELRTTAQPVRGSWEPGREGDAFRLSKTVPAVDLTKRPFGGVWDFWSDWRHPETGIGPLYVIDECHLAMPRAATDRQVEEWFSLHRHFKADVLLITQSYGKVSRSICDLVQIVYRCRKNIALGSPSSYVRKVQDGIRGEVVNTAIRRYEKRFFGLYRSHTQTSALGGEAGASDVRPIWRHWSFYGAALCLVIVIGALSSGRVANPVAPTVATTAARPLAKPPAPAAAPSRSSSPPPATLAAEVTSTEAASLEPYASRGLHLTGVARMGTRSVYTFVTSQNGQLLASLTDADLVAAGYRWEPAGHCAGVAHFAGKARVVICDSPQIGVAMVQPQDRRADAPPPAERRIDRQPDSGWQRVSGSELTQ